MVHCAALFFEGAATNGWFAGGTGVIRGMKLDGPLRLFIAATVALLCALANPALGQDKVLRISWPTAETGFDPARVSDLYSNVVTEAIFERLLSYDYLARPAKLVPQTAEAMPDVADNGKTFTFRIRKGIYFADDPAFKGKRRELTADDYVYSFKRFVDPALRSPWASMIEDKIE